MESNKPAKSCEERISAAMEQRLQSIRENPEEAVETLLSLERVLTFKLCLSWGGPADFLELDWSPDDKAWKGGRYLFQDWFDGASRPINAETTQELAELYGIYPQDYG
jgi:hypothetical protein